MIKIEEKEDGSVEFVARSKNVIGLLTEFSMLVSALRDDLAEHYDLGTAVVSLRAAFYTGIKYVKSRADRDAIREAMRKEFEP